MTPTDAAPGSDAVVAVLLLALLVERELIRATTGRRAAGSFMSVAVVPLLAVFAVVLAARTADVLG